MQRVHCIRNCASILGLIADVYAKVLPGLPFLRSSSRLNHRKYNLILIRLEKSVSFLRRAFAELGLSDYLRSSHAAYRGVSPNSLRNSVKVPAIRRWVNE